MNNCALAICKVCGAHRKKKTPQEMASAGKGLFWYAGGKVLVHCVDGEDLVPLVPEQYKRNSQIYCRYGGGNVFYSGEISFIRASGTADITYVSGVVEPAPEKLKEWAVNPSMLRVKPIPPEPHLLHEGQNCFARLGKKSRYWPAKVVRPRHNDTYDLLYDQGEKEYCVQRRFIKLGLKARNFGTRMPAASTAYIKEQLRTWDVALLAHDIHLRAVAEESHHLRNMHVTLQQKAGEAGVNRKGLPPPMRRVTPPPPKTDLQRRVEHKELLERIFDNSDRRVHLDFADSELDDKACREIGDALRLNKYVTNLNVSGNGLQKASALALRGRPPPPPPPEPTAEEVEEREVEEKKKARKEAERRYKLTEDERETEDREVQRAAEEEKERAHEEYLRKKEENDDEAEAQKHKWGGGLGDYGLAGIAEALYCFNKTLQVSFNRRPAQGPPAHTRALVHSTLNNSSLPGTR
jgi:hypothetical protein